MATATFSSPRALISLGDTILITEAARAGVKINSCKLSVKPFLCSCEDGHPGTVRVLEQGSRGLGSRVTRDPARDCASRSGLQVWSIRLLYRSVASSNRCRTKREFR